eukprot:6202745-Pleurochrysis_carterae.AAC.1
MAILAGSRTRRSACTVHAHVRAYMQALRAHACVIVFVFACPCVSVRMYPRAPGAIGYDVTSASK